MEKEEFMKKDFELRCKIGFLNLKERNNLNHPLYQELEKLKKEYAVSLLKERESEINDKHKRK